MERSVEEIHRSMPERTKFYLDPLDAIRATFEPDDISSTTDSDPTGTTIKVFCNSVSHPSFTSRSVEVVKIKHYEKSFFDKVASEINAEIVLRSESEQTFTETGLFKKKASAQTASTNWL